MYTLKIANIKDISLLETWKLQTVLDYAGKLSIEEQEKISNYVHNEVLEYLHFFELIEVSSSIVGCVLVRPYQDGYLLDEIYLEKEYRNLGIGSSILKDKTMQFSPLYLWVYKDNQKAISLYKRIGFLVKEETAIRYFMEFVVSCKNQ